MEKSPPDSKEYLGIAPGHQRKIPEVPVSGFVIMLAVIAALGGLLFGYDTGVISGALLFLRPEFQLSASMVGTVTAIVLFGAVIGAAISGLLVEHFGRRIMLTIAAGVFSLGALVTALAPSISALIAGRFVLGIAIGIASYTSPLYISESAPARVRGALVSLSQLFITIGILAAYLVDFAFAYPEGWR